MIAIKIQQVRIPYNSFQCEDEAVLELDLIYRMFDKFKDYVNQLNPEDVVEITEEDGLKRYELIVRFDTASDDLKFS